jgi:hypothetical protein
MREKGEHVRTPEKTGEKGRKARKEKRFLSFL